MTQIRKKSNRHTKETFKSVWWLLGGWALMALLISLWIFLGVNPHLKKIESAAYEAKKIQENLANEIISFDLEVQGIDKYDSKKYQGLLNLVSGADIADLKKSLFLLKNQVDKAIERSHQDAVNIVDRVNLYTTFAIALLSLFGIFTPIYVQFIGNREFNKKIDDWENHYRNNMAKLEEKFQDKMDKLEGQFSSKTCELEVKAEDGVSRLREIQTDLHTNIPSLRLAYSLGRALDKNRIRWYSKSPHENASFLKETFENIAEDLEDCKSKGILPSNNSHMKGSLKDFHYQLQDVIRSYSSERDNLEKIKELDNKLSQFSKDTNDQKKALEDIIVFLKGF